MANRRGAGWLWLMAVGVVVALALGVGSLVIADDWLDRIRGAGLIATAVVLFVVARREIVGSRSR